MKGSAFFTKNNGVKLEKSSVFHRKCKIKIYLCTILEKYKILNESHQFCCFAAIRLVIVTFSGTLKTWYVTSSVAFVMVDDRFCFLITTQKISKMLKTFG